MRLLPLLALLTLLGACADGARELRQPVEPVGDFKLGHAIVVAPNLVKGPASREATKEEWIASVDSALEERFRRYEGDAFYHLGVSVEGYVLAQPGIPLVFSPKSVLIVRVTVFEDATGRKLNEEAEQITALEAPSGKTIVGSGVTQSAEEQMTNLSKNIALQIENWMRRQSRAEGWFGGPAPAEEATAETAAPAAADAAPAAPGLPAPATP
ncbi:hypothetical protein [Roseivivax isoporae]|uniref:Lipoprotein n=1 Tax=Roseivivax isoporae LMG 25204 TaxID=1449351 RepID=X7F479_9RHOB|nr:hypothetical protein [Roseivivax isoporae]ETX27508.1 hypothetical protein RISW2_13855 [Roseivivax isoporae LMG 25204]